MKSSTCLLILSALAVSAAAWGGGWGGCKKDDDCKEDECCVKQHGGHWSQCLKRPQEGQHCVPETSYNDYFKKGNCPCGPGFECRAGPKGTHPGMEFTKPPVCTALPVENPEATHAPPEVVTDLPSVQ